jgi:hypothetical protein
MGQNEDRWKVNLGHIHLDLETRKEESYNPLNRLFLPSWKNSRLRPELSVFGTFFWVKTIPKVPV